MKDKKIPSQLLTSLLCLLLIGHTATLNGQSFTASDDEEAAWSFNANSQATFLYVTLNDSLHNLLNSIPKTQLSYNITTQPQHAVISTWLTAATTPRINYKPVKNFTGRDSLQYEICDNGNGTCATAWVYITVSDTCIPNLCVWPGDANGDGKANNKDILTLGLGYGTIGGAVRDSASIAWSGQLAQNWDKKFDKNFKHIDGTGDGNLNAADTLPILLNYDTVSVNKGSGENSEGMPIVIEFTTEGLEPGDIATANIYLGTEEEPFLDMYGFALSVDYNPAIIAPYTGQANYANSWIATSDPYVQVQRDIPSYGRFDIGFSRTDKQSKGGFGLIAQVKFQIIDNLDEKDNLYNAVNMALSSAVVINARGETIPVSVTSTSVPLITSDRVEEASEATQIKIYPNPSKDVITMQYQGVVIDNVELVALTGEVVRVYDNLPESQLSLSLDGLASNVYFLRLNTNRGILIEKLIKQ